jgi:opacity protein-like surface antigen
MKKLVLTLAAILALAAAPAAYAADHTGHDMHAGHADISGATHEEVVDGVKATFNVQTMADAMKAMGMEMPKGVKETHHISLALKDVKSGKALTEGEATVKVQGPDKKEQARELMGMHGHFGADFEMAKKGKYGVMCKFKPKDGKVRQAKFWYTVK